MWFARNKNGIGLLFDNKPVRVHVTSHQKPIIEDGMVVGYETIHCADYWDDKSTELGYIYTMGRHLFPEVTWEDEPIEVEIKIKDKIKQTRKCPDSDLWFPCCRNCGDWYDCYHDDRVNADPRSYCDSKHRGEAERLYLIDGAKDCPYKRIN